jgi:aspartate/methionine/tyrosine aminotransferase
LSLIADMFADENTTLIVPTPSWGNYRLLFSLRAGAKIKSYPFFREGRFNLEGLSDVMRSTPGKLIVVLNFPSNPTGYSPTPEEADAIADRMAQHPSPAVFVCDDAYQGVVHEQHLVDHSVFWRVAGVVDPERGLVVKVDGATKELMFFPSRIGFLSAAIPQEAEAAWVNKVNCLVRGSVGSPPGPSQAIMMQVLQDHDATRHEFVALREQLTMRYRALRDAVACCDNPRFVRFPFNAAYFALIGLTPDVSAEAVRQELLAQRSVGVIAIDAVNALRIAYCSTRVEDLAEIVGHIDEIVRKQ